MVYFNTNENDEIEIDGIFFKTLMPERVVTIPPKQSDAKTAVLFGIQITNSKANSQRFLLFFLRPEFFLLDRQTVFQSGPNVNKIYNPELADFQLLMPGESVIFLLKGYFQWKKNELWFSFCRKDGCYWSFGQFTQNNYLIECVYENRYSARKQRKNSDPIDFVPVWKKEAESLSGLIKIEDIWTGEIHTSPIEFQLVET